MKSFWNDLPRPFTILAPMDGVTDVVFRKVILEIGRPDVFFTEFTSCDGIMSKGREKVAQSLKFSKEESPCVAQIWGHNPDTFFETAKFCRDLGFQGIDVNMGCPDKTIVRSGSCSALIKNPKLSGEIIEATKKGAGDLPVSVKTRMGFSEEEIDEWIGFLLKQDLPAITIHLRTVSELSKVPAHWEKMPKIMKLRDEINPKTLIIGNGDLMSLSEIEEKYDEYGCEGFMVGRGIFNNPWLFNKKVKIEEITTSQRLDLYAHHINLFVEMWKGKKNTASLKKFGKTYINNFEEASILREKIMRAKNTTEMLELINNYSHRNLQS